VRERENKGKGKKHNTAAQQWP